MATAPWTDTPPDVSERYETASNTSNLTVGSGMVPKDHRTPVGDVVAASGMAAGRLRPDGKGGYVLLPVHHASIGMALLRLHSEWESSAKPKRPTRAQVEARIESLKVADERERQRRIAANGELARLQAVLEATDGPERFDLLVAIMEQRRLWENKALPLPEYAPLGSYLTRAADESQRWYANELRLLVVRLKSRAQVLEHLMRWAAIKGITAETVSDAVLHWLSPTCAHCDGHGFRFLENQAVRPCGRCQGGERKTDPAVDRVLREIACALGIARGALRKRLRRV